MYALNMISCFIVAAIRLSFVFYDESIVVFCVLCGLHVAAVLLLTTLIFLLASRLKPLVLAMTRRR